MESTTTLAEPQLDNSGIITDLLSQAITGELIGMSNFASLAGAIDDVEEMMEAVHVGAAIKSGATLVHGVMMMNKVNKLDG